MHKNQLHPSLGHPDNLLQLDTLCQREIKRHKDQADGINLNTKMLQVIVKPLLNRNLSVAFGKERTSWIHFSSTSRVNRKMENVFSFRQSCSHVFSLLSYVSSALDQYMH